MSEMPSMIGRYRVVRPLGQGATATVYLAIRPEDDQQVAIKVVNIGQESQSLSRRMKKLFMTEANVAKRLNHPNIVRVFDAVVEEKQAYIVMEYIAGQSLENFCTIDRLLPLHRVIGIVFKCCMALDYAYKQGVIHRDIKPANILLGEGDVPKISDFGLALNFLRDKDADSTFIMGVGSPAFMSPEQIKSYPLNQKTDLYSLGVVLFQLLTGRLPFRGKSHAALVYRIINADIPKITSLNPQLPAALDSIISKALEKDLFSRYANGAEFAKDLSTVRYQILTEDTVVRDEERFSLLRKMSFFCDFEDIELWEVLRISVWRQFVPKVLVMEEGTEGRQFGVIISGQVEVSMAGRVICRLGPGELVGEMAYLSPRRPVRQASVVTLGPVEFLEINPSALDLSSEECRERFQKTLVAKLIDRMHEANRLIAKLGASATEGNSAAVPLIDLVPPLSF